MRDNRERQHDDRSQSGDEHEPRVGEPGYERIAAAEQDELAVGATDATERVLLTAIRDELGRAAQELDELCRQLTSGSCLPSADDAAQPRGQKRNRHTRDEQPERKRDCGGRQKECHGGDAGDPDGQGDGGRSEATEVQALQRVDVCNQPGYEVAATERIELGRRERLDLLVDPRTDTPEPTQRDVVRDEPLQIAGERPCEREEADDHYRRRQGKNRGLLGRARDEIAGGGDQRHAEADCECTQHN